MEIYNEHLESDFVLKMAISKTFLENLDIHVKIENFEKKDSIRLAIITERFEHLDIALVDMFPSSMFTNNEDF